MGIFGRKTENITIADLEIADVELRETTLERLAGDSSEDSNGRDGEIRTWLNAYSTYALTVPSKVFIGKVSADSELRSFAEGVGDGFDKAWKKEASRYRDAAASKRDEGLSRLMRSFEMSSGMQGAILAGLGWTNPPENGGTVKQQADANFVWDLSLFYIGDARIVDERRRRANGLACGYRVADWSMWTTHQGLT